MSSIARFKTAFLNGDKQQMHNAWDQLDRELDNLKTRTGGSQLTKADTPSDTAQIIAPPPSASFAVQGQGVGYLVRITNPQGQTAQSANQALAQPSIALNSSGAPLYHNLQSAKDFSFSANSNLIDHGISAQTSFLLPTSNQCWRLRSSYDGQTWNDWQPVNAGTV